MDFREDLKKQGYSKEEQYFAKMNQELIDKRRRELDAQKKTAPDHSTQAWWMTCPKCGTRMKEVNQGGILIDRCDGCGGTYFDAGELETLTQAQEPKKFLDTLRKMF